MRRAPKSPAFTLIELLVVVGIIALLLSILLPTLAGAREQGKRAKCLANMKSIGSACWAYANEDQAEQLMPIHMNMVRSCPYWQWRLINWMAWGGRSAQKRFLFGGGSYWLCGEGEVPPGAPSGTVVPEYGARRRPLNLYILSDVNTADTRKLEWFHCPSDRGYPDHPDIDDSPRENAERACYDTIGSSYRASLCMIALGYFNGPSYGHFSRGPWGHKTSSLLEVSKLVLVGEPAFFNMIGMDAGGAPPDPVLVTGWHKKLMKDNLLFCDGSARSTQASGRWPWDPGAIQQMQIWNGNYRILSRGRTWRLDCYPVPGARIFGSNLLWRDNVGAFKYDNQWPFANRQENLRN